MFNAPARQPQSVPKRYTYNTVDEFVSAVSRVRTVGSLNALRISLVKGATGDFAGVHPFRSGSSEYVDCWKATQAKGLAMGWQYDWSYGQFIAPVRA